MAAHIQILRKARQEVKNDSKKPRKLKACGAVLFLAEQAYSDCVCNGLALECDGGVTAAGAGHIALDRIFIGACYSLCVAVIVVCSEHQARGVELLADGVHGLDRHLLDAQLRNVRRLDYDHALIVYLHFVLDIHHDGGGALAQCLDIA